MADPQSRPGRSALKTSAGALALAAAATSVLACAVSPSDLQRWETTSEGPKRLSAVVLFDKYPTDLRVGASMALIDMKPVKGQRVGIERLVKGALVCDSAWLERKHDEPCERAALTPESRGAIVAGLIPRIIEELKKAPPPAAQPGQPVAADPSYKFKDAAYMLLTYEKTPIVADPALKQQLLDALRDWAMVDFGRKLNDQTQMFGMEQLLRLIGPSGLEKVPSLMSRDNLRDLMTIAGLIDKLASDKTKEDASRKLVEIIDYVASDAWLKDKQPEVKASNEQRQLAPTADQFKQQMSDYQDDQMTKVFAAMKKVGGQAVTDQCLKIAADKGRSQKVRMGALVALENRIDKKDEASIKKLLELAKIKDQPPLVDAAFRLLKQLPREAVGSRLFPLLENDNWQVRRLAGSTILQMSKTEHLKEFMKELGARATKNFNPMEARTYAAYIADMKDGSPRDAVKPFLKSDNIRARVIAISYFLLHGSKNDLPLIKPLADAGDKVPACEEKDNHDCMWSCIVVENDKRQEKKVDTLGDFVKHCVLPTLSKQEPKKDEPAKDNPASSGAK